MKISIVTTYYNRWPQFEATLKRFNELYKGRHDWDLVVVDDCSDDEHALTKERLKFCDFNIQVVQMPPEKKYCNPCVPFNVGFVHAYGEVVLIQNPECTHYDNILDDCLKLEDNEYRVYSCFSANPEQTEEIKKSAPKLENIFEGNTKSASRDGSFDSWYQHKDIRNHSLHFCAAIKNKDLRDLQGFDQRFAKGVGYDDNEFLHRIKMKNMNITCSDKVVYHQYHKGFCGNQEYKPEMDNYSLFHGFTLNRKSYRSQDNE